MVDTIIFSSGCYIHPASRYLPNFVVSSYSVVSHVNRSAICRRLTPRSFDGFSSGFFTLNAKDSILFRARYNVRTSFVGRAITSRKRPKTVRYVYISIVNRRDRKYSLRLVHNT